MIYYLLASVTPTSIQYLVDIDASKGVSFSSDITKGKRFDSRESCDEYSKHYGVDYLSKVKYLI